MPVRLLLLLSILAPALSALGAPPDESPAGWYLQGGKALQDGLDQRPVTGAARNIILFLGDGMGISTVTASRILAGQRAGGSGEEHVLSFERFPHVALIKTYTVDQQVPDSAGTMSAIMTGIKTLGGVLSVDQDVVRGDCASARGHERETLLEQFEAAGRATGIVTTTRVTRSTSAATYAHLPERDWEGDTDLPAGAGPDCRDIARQLVEFDTGDGIDVVMGGGRTRFLPHTAPDPEYPRRHGLRRDGRDLVAEWRRRHPEGVYLWNGADFATLDSVPATRLLALFQPSHMRHEAERATDPGHEPSLAQMTAAAIRILSRNARGYFLLVEGGRIDHALHDTNAYHALSDTLALDEAVATATTLTNPDDTLILVTADHSHALTLAGYPARGNPILGKVVMNDATGHPEETPAVAADGRPYTTLTFAIGPQASGQRRSLRHTDTTAPDFIQDAAVPMRSGTHAGEDVAAWARGPWAHLVHGVQEQHYLYHVMHHAAQLGE